MDQKQKKKFFHYSEWYAKVCNTFINKESFTETWSLKIFLLIVKATLKLETLEFQNN